MSNKPGCTDTGALYIYKNCREVSESGNPLGSLKQVPNRSAENWFKLRNSAFTAVEWHTAAGALGFDYPGARPCLGRGSHVGFSHLTAFFPKKKKARPRLAFFSEWSVAASSCGKMNQWSRIILFLFCMWKCLSLWIGRKGKQKGGGAHRDSKSNGLVGTKDIRPEWKWKYQRWG